jgi:Na+/proline symporter
MPKKEVKKDFNYVWDIIECPVFVIIIYSLLELFFSISKYIEKVIPANIFGIILAIFIFGWIGYNASRENDEEPSRAAKYGAYAGMIVGFVSAIIGIITFYFYPEKLAESLQKAAQAGADMAMVQTFMKIGIYANLVLSPAIYAGIGAFIAWISGMIFKRKEKRRR